MNLLCGLIAVAVSTAACLKFLPRKVLLPTLTFILAYGATTVVGASFLLDPFGQAQFQYFIGTDAVQYMATLGSISYWSLLLMPLVLAPVGSIAGYKLSQPISGVAASFVGLRLWLPSVALLLTLLTAYCAYKLWLADALAPLSAIDPKICIEDKIQRRASLILLLGNSVYKVLYAAVPILAALTLTYAIRCKKRSSFVLCGLSILLGAWLCLALYMKAPILIILIGAAVAGIAAGIASLIVLPVTIIAGAVIFSALTVTQVCEAPAISPTIYHLPKGSKNPGAAIAIKIEPPGESAQPYHKMLYFAVQIARAPVFRMAAGFPYYVDIFSDPGERCGVWAPYIFPSSCFPPIKAYEVAYPFRPNATTGYLPAPVNTSALAEAGYAYSVLATLLVGFIIGIISRFCGYKTPFSVAFTVAACIFAYYASQVSLTASLIDSYGLLWLALTIAAAWIISFLAQWKRSEPS